MSFYSTKINKSLTKIWVGLVHKNSSMINHPPQRKLRRSFGSQPVGCLGGPRQPEAGVAVQATQAQSSRWTFPNSDDGDLANPVAGDHGGQTHALFSGLSLGLSSAFRKKVERFASAAPQDHAKPLLSRATIQASPQISTLRIIFRSSNPSSRWMPRGTPSHQVVNSGRIKIILILIG